METPILQRAEAWTREPFDPETRDRVRQLIDSDPRSAEDAFYRDLEFGTGGMRGVMGPGTNRMNIYTLGMAAQGFANYLKSEFPGEDISVALAHDCRNNSRFFAEHCAKVFDANGIRVLLFDRMAPTPLLSFAIRHHGCKGGAVITASHNPPEYNGFKVYWADGAQVVSPHDNNIIAAVRAIESPADVKVAADTANIRIIGSETDEAYLNLLDTLTVSPEESLDKSVRIVYTALHGTGSRLIPRALRERGYQCDTVAAQDTPDGYFSTVASPNPEEPEALEMAMAQAFASGADLVMGTDPDADRVGIAVRDDRREFVLLNGNQTAALLVHYYLTRLEEDDRLTGSQFVCKTIVTSPLIDEICTYFDVACYDTLTGFKYIADIIRKKEGKEQYLIGGEESYGYLIGDFVRDKDAVSAAVLIAEMAAWAKHNGMSLFDLLKDIYLKYGFRTERLISLTKKGRDGLAEIESMMTRFRNHPPETLAGSPVVVVRDVKSGIEKDLRSGEERKLALPSSNVLQFLTEDDTLLTARPSGTEPKIKFYLSVRADLESAADYNRVAAEVTRKIDIIEKDAGL
jgi:phosphoglucomutase